LIDVEPEFSMLIHEMVTKVCWRLCDKFHKSMHVIRKSTKNWIKISFFYLKSYIL